MRAKSQVFQYSRNGKHKLKVALTEKGEISLYMDNNMCGSFLKGYIQVLFLIHMVACIEDSLIICSLQALTQSSNVQDYPD